MLRPDPSGSRDLHPHDEVGGLGCCCYIRATTRLYEHRTSDELGETGLEPATSRPSAGALPLSYHSQSNENPASAARWSRRRELNPSIPVWRTDVSPQHFACRRGPLAESPGGRTVLAPRGHGSRSQWVGQESLHRGTARSAVPARDEIPRGREAHAGARSAPPNLVGRRGIEPPFYGLRNRCNASVCYRPMSPTPWNRTRSSCSSDRRADHVRESGLKRAPRDDGAPTSFVSSIVIALRTVRAGLRPARVGAKTQQ